MYPHFENKWIRHTAHISLCQYDIFNFTLGDEYFFFFKALDYVTCLCILFGAVFPLS